MAIPIALVFGVLMTALSVTGTENTAKLQNGIAFLLLAILTVFLTYGGFDALGVFRVFAHPRRSRPSGPAQS